MRSEEDATGSASEGHELWSDSVRPILTSRLSFTQILVAGSLHPVP